ncbi:MAG TPA: DNA repair protein RecN [Flavobacterium sp.]|nr:DNA repair protein RecN [Flavobacterium sp.]
MLISLSIKNYTLIEHLNIDFSSGFSVITGETGAGKSMLLGALGLVLGKRADLSSLKNPDEKCIIEVVFAVEKYQLKEFFAQIDLDYEDQSIIRREILPSGKSRAFVNDSPVTLQQLDELGSRLMDIHSQHQTQELSEDTYQFEILDILAANRPLLTEYAEHLKSYKAHKKALEQALKKREEALKEQEYDMYILEELAQAKLKKGEQEQLEETYEQLSNVETIKEALSNAVHLSDNEVSGVYQQLTQMKALLAKIASFSPTYTEVHDRIESLQIEAADVLQEMNSLADSVVDNPSALQEIGDRLQLLYDLQKKHRAANLDELIAVKEQLQQKLVSVEELNTVIEVNQQRIATDQKDLDRLALALHANRTKAIGVFDQKMTLLLAELGMENARFDIQLQPTAEYYANGKDRIDFLFSANKGGQFGLLKKTASGGELSRIMLATKAIIASYQTMPTIIFDEIDTGVSGEIAQKMAVIMQQMSQSRQVISITHLPQIASKGDAHYKVYKSVTESDTLSDLKLLSKEERVEEIAQMLSGENPSESALLHAKTLLSN